MDRVLTVLSCVLLCALVAAGVWLIVAPYAVGYQPQGTPRTGTTRDDLITGIILLGVALLGFGAYLTATIRFRVSASAATAREASR